MSDFVKAAAIFLKYGDPSYPFNCSHDKLTVCGYDPADFSPADIHELDSLGFTHDEFEDCFYSFRFGSC